MDFSSNEYHQKKLVQIIINIENGTSDRTTDMKGVNLFWLNQKKNNTGKYVFRTMSCPPEVEQIIKLETDLILMIKKHNV